MSQGSVEGFNGTIKTYLSRLLKPEEENQWDMVVNRIEFAYNSERLRAFQTSKEYRDSMIQYVQDRSLKDRLRINATRSEEARTEDWFPGQLVMRRNPKPSAIGTDFWFGPDLIDSISVNGSVRVIPSDGQTNPVNHRDLKAFIPKNLSDAEERKLESSKDLELLELRDLDAEAEIESKDPEISSIPQKVAFF